MPRKYFQFYFTFRETAQTMPPRLRAVFYEAIIEYGTTGKEPTLPKSIAGYWPLVKPTLDSAKAHYDAGAKGGRPSKNNLSQVGTSFRADEILAQDAGESRNQIQRFIRLNKLTPELMKMVDDGKLKTTPAVELSYLTPEEQEDFLSYMESEGCTPSLSQAQKLKEASKESVLTPEKIQHIMAAKPPSVKPRDPQLMIPVAKVERYFPKGFTSDQMQQVIVKLLENYARAHQHGSR